MKLLRCSESGTDDLVEEDDDAEASESEEKRSCRE
jgi:hypothetical protein